MLLCLILVGKNVAIRLAVRLQVRGWRTLDPVSLQAAQADDGSMQQDLQASKRKLSALDVSFFELLHVSFSNLSKRKQRRCFF